MSAVPLCKSRIIPGAVELCGVETEWFLIELIISMMLKEIV